MGARFPFTSFPRGWYVVGASPEVPAGTVKTVHYFGQDIVLFRTESGVLSAVDKTCPHLGAHLGVGHVRGECLRCPFHDWGFATDGRCVDVPYAPKIPAKAVIKTWHMRELNGLIFVYFCPAGLPPTWEIPEMDMTGWTPNRVIRWELRSHPQEIAENTVDCSHLKPVHHVHSTEVMAVECTEHTMHVVLNMVASGAPIGMPEEINDVELDVTLHGLGQIISRTHVRTADLRAMQRIHATPVDEERIAIFGVNNTKETADPGYTREVDDLFWGAFIVDFPKDFPIWESKAYIDKPLLVGGDGPIGRYRRWCRQFYPELATQAAAQTTAEARARPPLVRSVVMIEAERFIGDELSVETRYYLSSLPNDAKLLNEAVRSHWAVENSLHWVLDVTFQLRLGDLSAPIGYADLARGLGVEVGQRVPLSDARDAVLAQRRRRGMVLDADDHDTWSAGSFFTNPVLPRDDFERLVARLAGRLGDDVVPPTFPVDGRDVGEYVKTSAAWLIERAGFGRGYDGARPTFAGPLITAPNRSNREP